MDEPWIPVLTGDAHGTPDQVVPISLREAMNNAHLYRGLASADPDQRVSQLRLLLGLTHRALMGPISPDQATDWAETGFPADQLSAYLDRHRERFWLIHPDAPFLQVAGLERYGQPDPKGKKAAKPFLASWQVLSPRVSMGNSSPLFNPNQRRSVEYQPAPVPLAEVAALLVAHQTFSLGGLDKRLTTSVTGSPVFSAVLVSVVGETLLETLALNLRLYPADLAARDLPSWERAPLSAEVFVRQLAENTGRPVQGPVDRYSWINRGVTLLAEPGPDGTQVVDQIIYAGCQLDSSPERFGQGNEVDPMVALRPTKAAKSAPTFTTVKASPARALWPTLDLILPDHRTRVTFMHEKREITLTGQEPGTLVSARALLRVRRNREQERLNAGATLNFGDGSGFPTGGAAPVSARPLQLQLVALMADNTKLLGIRSEEFLLPERLIAQPERLTGELHQLLMLAAAGERALNNAGFVLAQGLQRHSGVSASPRDNLQLTDKKARAVFQAFVTGLPGVQYYWGALQPHFEALLLLLGEETPGQGSAAGILWRAALLEALDFAWAENERSAGTDSWALRATSLGALSMEWFRTGLRLQIADLRANRGVTPVPGLELFSEDEPDVSDTDTPEEES